jgi:NitT/TauT family transport system substrate-binding protein
MTFLESAGKGRGLAGSIKKTSILFFCIMLAMSGGCAKKPPEPKLTPVTIAFHNWVGRGLFYLAQEKGFFKEDKEGIDLIFVDEQLDSSRRDAFEQGMLDLEAGTLDLLVSKAAQGVPLTAVMNIDQSSGADAIIAAANIRNLEDLAGKKVALAKNDSGEMFLSALLYKNNLSVNNVIIVPAPPEEVSEIFLEGQADACVTWEPQVSKALKRKGSHILASTKEYPDIVIATLNVRKDLLERNPALIKKVMRAWFKALGYYREHPLEASEIISGYYGISPERYRKRVEGIRWEDYEEQVNNLVYKKWTDAFNLIVEVKSANGRIFRKPEASNCLNHELLEKLYEDGK